MNVKIFTLSVFNAMEETEELQLQGVKGRRMSNYGVKTYTPEQIKEQWRESMRVMWNTNNSIQY